MQKTVDTVAEAGSSSELPAVSADNVRKEFGEFVALDDVSLEVRPGELISLLGPSGSGKTTLLNIFAGFLRPTHGTVRFHGEDMTVVPPHRRGIGVVFQHYALFPHMTVGQNVAYPLRVRRMNRAHIKEKVTKALATVQLQGLDDRGIEQLSGGQKQRVALARAIVFEPKIILMDEPLSALDKQLREHMQIELRELHERLSATTIYVTHDQREALTLSDQIAVLNHGRIMQQGTPTELYEDPKNSFVADFVGETSMIKVTRTGDDSIQFGGNELRTRRVVPDADSLYLAIRTEKLLLMDPDSEAGENTFSGRVRHAVYQGESMRLFIDIDDNTEVSVRRLCQAGDTMVMPKSGDNVRLHLPPESTVVVAD